MIILPRDIRNNNLVSEEYLSQNKEVLEHNLHYQTYQEKIKEIPNVVVDSANLFHSELITPFQALYSLVSHKFNESEVNLHFIVKQNKMIRYIIQNLFSLDEDLAEKVKRFNIYFHVVNLKNPFLFLGYDKNHKPIQNEKYSNIDDLCALYLFAYLNIVGKETYISSNDFRMVKDHILNKDYKNYEPFEVNIYTLDQGLSAFFVVAEKFDFSKSDSLYDYYYGFYINDRISMKDLKKADYNLNKISKPDKSEVVDIGELLKNYELVGVENNSISLFREWI